LNTDKIFQGGRSQNIRRRSENNHQISCGRGAWTIRSMSSEQRKHRGEEQIPSIGSEHRGSTIVGSGWKCTSLNIVYMQEGGLAKSPEVPEVIWDHPSSGRTRGGNPSIFGWKRSLGGTRAQKFETFEARRVKSRRESERQIQRNTCFGES
jgi:hypothetical protein